MNYVPNQNGKVLEETLAGFNRDAVKTTLRSLLYLKMTLPFLQVLQKSLPIPLSVCHIQYREYCKLLSRLRYHIQSGRLPLKIPRALARFSDPVCYVRAPTTFRSN